MITLILGGARSGKSQRAESLAATRGLPVCYIATAPKISGDVEWDARIKKHCLQRPRDWETVEETLLLPEVLNAHSGCGEFLLVDCLTLWLSNILYAKRNMSDEIQRLCQSIKEYEGEIVFVSNEVGLGLVPESQLGREFRDAQGFLNQHVAAVADHVEFVAAGLPIVLKDKG